MKEIEIYKNKFDEYTNKYLLIEDKYAYNFKMKYSHTMRVLNIALEIAESEKLSDFEKKAVYLSALFHDIGRFKQYYKYKCFDDGITGSHAKMSVEILREEGWLDNLDNDLREIVLSSIDVHSDYKLNYSLDSILGKVSAILRDADKLDGYFIVLEETKQYDLSVLDKSKLISDEVKKSIVENSCVKKKDIKFAEDRNLLMVALIFDINFKYSFEKIIYNKYIERLFQKMKKNDEMLSLKNICIDYINTKAKEALDE